MPLEQFNNNQSWLTVRTNLNGNFTELSSRLTTVEENGGGDGGIKTDGSFTSAIPFSVKHEIIINPITLSGNTTLSLGTAPVAHSFYVFETGEDTGAGLLSFPVGWKNVGSKLFNVNKKQWFHLYYTGSEVRYTITDLGNKAVQADNLPQATSVTITGTLMEGSTLTGSYTYFDADADPESGTTRQWYRADDNIGTNKVAISGATNTTYVLQSADIGKVMQYGVTPANANGTGSQVLSAYTNVVAANTMLLTYDFTGTTVDTSKVELVNPADNIAVSQNNGAIFTCSAGTAVQGPTNRIRSAATFNTPTIVMAFDVSRTGTTDFHTPTAGLWVGEDNNNRIVIQKASGTPGTAIAIYVVVGGTSVYSVANTGVTMSGNRIKIKKTATTVEFLYWNGSAWVSLNTGGTPYTLTGGEQTALASLRAMLSHFSNTTTDATTTYNRLRVTSADYTTELP